VGGGVNLTRGGGGGGGGEGGGGGGESPATMRGVGPVSGFKKKCSCKKVGVGWVGAVVGGGFADI